MGIITCTLNDSTFGASVTEEDRRKLLDAALDAYNTFWGERHSEAAAAREEFKAVKGQFGEQTDLLGDIISEDFSSHDAARHWQDYLNMARDFMGRAAYDLGLQPTPELFDFEIKINTAAIAPPEGGWAAFHAKQKASFDFDDAGESLHERVYGANCIPDFSVSDLADISPENVVIEEIEDVGYNDPETHFLDTVATFNAAEDVYKIACRTSDEETVEQARHHQTDAWAEVVAAAAFVTEDFAKTANVFRTWQSAYSQYTATNKAPAQPLGL